MESEAHPPIDYWVARCWTCKTDLWRSKDAELPREFHNFRNKNILKLPEVKKADDWDRFYWCRCPKGKRRGYEAVPIFRSGLGNR